MKSVATTITRNEWKEISLVPEVQETFNRLDFIDLQRMVHGAKFVYQDDECDHITYTLVGGYVEGLRTVILERTNGVLKFITKQLPGEIM